MKIKIIILIILLMTSATFASAKKPSGLATFEKSDAWSKLDLKFREAWHGALSKGERSKIFECMLKAQGPISDDDKIVLKSAGFVARTYIGAIVTGSVTAASLPAVANLDFVQAIELATPLAPK